MSVNISGDRVAMYSDLGYKSSVVDVDFHPHDNMVAFAAFSEHHAVLIYKYDHQGMYYWEIFNTLTMCNYENS